MSPSSAPSLVSFIKGFGKPSSSLPGAVSAGSCVCEQGWASGLISVVRAACLVGGSGAMLFE